MAWKLVSYAPRYRASVLALMEQVQGYPISAQRFIWEFERNPVGDINLFLALHGDDVVGVSCHNTFCMRLEGREELVSFPLNVVTRPDFRGRGVFSTLERANEERAAETGSALMLSFPNADSAPIFLNRLGWRALPAGPRLLGRPRPLVPPRRPLPLMLKPEPRFDRWADEVWAESSHMDRCLARGSTYLNWRFVECPQASYRVLTARRGREVVGYMVSGTTVKRGLRVAYVANALMMPEWRSAYPAMRQGTLARAREPLMLDLEDPAGDTRGSWRQATRYVRLPKRLRLIAKSIRPEFDEAWLRQYPWFFQLGDLDFF